MVNREHEESLKNMQDILNSATKSIEIHKNTISKSISKAEKEVMSPTNRKILNMSKDFMNYDISKPEEIIKKQQEFTDLMAVAQREANK